MRRRHYAAAAAALLGFASISRAGVARLDQWDAPAQDAYEALRRAPLRAAPARSGDGVVYAARGPREKLTERGSKLNAR